MALAYLGLGSNLGERQANIDAARRGLAMLPDSILIKNAAIYATKPVGGPPDQGEFLNSASLVDTFLEPMAFLAEIHKLERSIGRFREHETVRWGPRIIDIDILLWDDLIMDEKDLVIPHPRLAERAFALLPLADLDRDVLHPALDLTIAELLERTECGDEGIRRLPL